MNETDRQYYFMEKASGHVAKLGEELGRRPTCCVTTFGCQMNARDSEKLVGILEKVGYEIIEDENADFVIYNLSLIHIWPPYWEMMTWASLALGSLIFTGNCNLFS